MNKLLAIGLACCLPTGLAAPAIAIAAGDGAAVDTARLVTTIAGSALLIVAALGGAVAAFRRREL